MKRNALAAAVLAACALVPALAMAQPLSSLEAARAAVERRDWAAALPLFESLIARESANADLWIEAARVSGFADRNAEAASRYRRVLEIAPSRRADVLPSLAWQTLWSGDAVGAEPLFDELTRATGDRAEAWDGLGQARDARGDLSGAIDAWRASLALRPARVSVERRLARALLWSDRHAEAADVLKAAIDRDPADRDSAWLLANVRNFAGHHQQAVQDFQRLGAPRSAGERFDLARAWGWAGFEDRAAALLAGHADPEAAWWRDHRLSREGRTFAWAGLEHSVDSDSLESWSWTAAAGWRPWAGATAELRARRLELTDAVGDPAATELQASLRWRVGEPGVGAGVAWPAIGIRVADWGGWTPGTGFARVAWLPADGWRVDAEAARDLVETPRAIEQRVSVDTVSIGVDHRPLPRLGLVAGVATQRFDDGNRRERAVVRADWRIMGRPRWSAGVEALHFESERPTGPTIAGRGYWNPARYSEARVTTALELEQRPWDFSLRLGTGTSREVDGFGTRSKGSPDNWELAAGFDAGPSARWRIAFGGSGSGLGVGNGGGGYWRRYGSIVFNGWF
jgi:tetratricopeptide (TPR) repeat protein